MVTTNSRGLTLYTSPDGLDGHRVRLVLAEKGVAGYSLVEVDDHDEDLAAVNPYNSVPTLVDRDLVLYDARTIVEYLDERYPQPALMPVDPAQRARYRMALLRLETELYEPGDELEDCGHAARRKARARMQDALTRLASDLMPSQALGEAYSLLDCTIAPVLWRLDYYRLQLPARPDQLLRDYAAHLFRREAFTKSLSKSEAAMRQRRVG